MAVTSEMLTSGDRVILTNPDPGYTIHERNPTVGSRWFCGGKILNPGVDGEYISVRWDNGERNSYKDYELSFEEDFNVGICVSLWEN
jgi:hypothetical protein